MTEEKTEPTLELNYIAALTREEFIVVLLLARWCLVEMQSDAQRGSEHAIKTLATISEKIQPSELWAKCGKLLDVLDRIEAERAGGEGVMQ